MQLSMELKARLQDDRMQEAGNSAGKEDIRGGMDGSNCGQKSGVERMLWDNPQDMRQHTLRGRQQQVSQTMKACTWM
jgi:hypothetical protein